jgi:hypothetical protein
MARFLGIQEMETVLDSSLRVVSPLVVSRLGASHPANFQEGRRTWLNGMAIHRM